MGCSSTQRSSLAASSRSTTFWHYAPPPEQDLEGFLSAVEAAIGEIGYEVILPSSDAETLALSFGRARLRASIPYPPHEHVVRAFDKFELAKGARRAELSSPWTVLATKEELSRIDGHVVVKARLHWTPETQGGPNRWEAEIARDAIEASRRVAEIRAGGGEPLLQEEVHGRIMHCHLTLGQDGKAIAVVQQLSEPLTWPPGAGTRVRSMTVPVDHELANKATRFLNDLGWFGFASLQFIQPDDGPPQLIDFNGRLSLSFEQSIAAGPNFPALWASVATGREPGNVPPVKSGIRFQWLEGDIHRALVQRQGGALHDLMDCLRYARGAVHGIWRADDPRPALVYWSYYLGGACSQLIERAKGYVVKLGAGLGIRRLRNIE